MVTILKIAMFSLILECNRINQLIIKIILPTNLIIKININKYYIVLKLGIDNLIKEILLLELMKVEQV